MLVDCEMDSYMVSNSSFIRYNTNYTTGLLNYTVQGISNHYSVCPITHIDVESEHIDKFYWCDTYRTVSPTQVTLNFTNPRCMTFGVNTSSAANYTFFVKMRSFNVLQTPEKIVLNATL